LHDQWPENPQHGRGRVIVGAGASTSYSQNVTIENCTINNAYRNGISVISVNGLLVNNVRS